MLVANLCNFYLIKEVGIKKNALANYVGQAYTSLIGVVMLPLYLEYLGAEAYGLVGFFTVMQAWLGLLDLGLAPTLSRYVVCERSGNPLAINLKNLLRSIEWLFALSAIALGLAIGLSSDWIVRGWLNLQDLPQETAAYCVMLMGATVSVRWFAALYRAGLYGLEQMVWLNAALILLSSVRFIGAYAILQWITRNPAHFFEFQLVIAVLEAFVLGTRFYIGLGWLAKAKGGFSWGALKNALPFASGVAYSALLSVVMTQSDKLILSHTLSLSEYGYFAIVSLVSNGLLVLAAPINQAILPRMTMLLSQGDNSGSLAVYRKATQVLVAMIFPLAGFLAVFPEDIMLLWTGDAEASDWGGEVLRWFVLGNALYSVGSLQYTLQLSHGRLKTHMISMSASAMLQLPILIIAAANFGAIGVAYSWFAIRFISFLIWPVIVHRNFAPGLHMGWLMRDLLPGCGVTVACLTGLSAASPFIDGVFYYVVAYLIMMIAVTMAVPMLRQHALGVFLRLVRGARNGAA